MPASMSRRKPFSRGEALSIWKGYVSSHSFHRRACLRKGLLFYRGASIVRGTDYTRTIDKESSDVLSHLWNETTQRRHLLQGMRQATGDTGSRKPNGNRYRSYFCVPWTGNANSTTTGQSSIVVPVFAVSTNVAGKPANGWERDNSADNLFTTTT